MTLFLHIHPVSQTLILPRLLENFCRVQSSGLGFIWALFMRSNERFFESLQRNAIVMVTSLIIALAYQLELPGDQINIQLFSLQ